MACEPSLEAQQPQQGPTRPHDEVISQGAEAQDKSQTDHKNGVGRHGSGRSERG